MVYLMLYVQLLYSLYYLFCSRSIYLGFFQFVLLDYVYTYTMFHLFSIYTLASHVPVPFFVFTMLICDFFKGPQWK